LAAPALEEPERDRERREREKDPRIEEAHRLRLSEGKG
jgi:hypothetical protein